MLKLTLCRGEKKNAVNLQQDRQNEPKIGGKANSAKCIQSIFDPVLSE